MSMAEMWVHFQTAGKKIMVESTSGTSTASSSGSTSRFTYGFLLGIAATIAMSVVMIGGMSTGVAPMPRPIPLAIVEAVLGSSAPQALLMILAVGSHLAYGGFWAGLMASWKPVTVGRGLLLGGVLWLVMQVFVLPLLGWGFFGVEITPKIAGATLVLHLIYGAALGGLGNLTSRSK